MKLVVFGGFIFLGGCILFGSYSISYTMGTGSTPSVPENLGVILMAIGGLLGSIGLGSKFIMGKKDE